MLPNFAKKHSHFILQRKGTKDAINQCIFDVHNVYNKEFDNDVALNIICEAYKQIDPPENNTSSKHCLINSNNSLVGCMEINPLVGTKCKVIEIVADISRDKMYIYLRNVGNNINNSNDVGRDQIKLFPITVGGPTHSICSAT